DLYERADTFDELYDAIVADLVDLARRAGGGEVVYAVPGSALVAERTVALLRERDDLTVVIEPAVSVIDVACAARGVDPMAAQLRVIDALAPGDRVRGPGPLLVLQPYAPEVLAAFADRLEPDTPVTVLHHLGLADEVVTTLAARRLATFAA
ncbi:tetrapyrrole methylase family protein, partial [mine drainage metagenome]